MSKNLEMSYLLDFYGELLKPGVRQTIDLYYNDDLSLSEVATQCGITRQGVRDRIEKAKAQLYTYEEKLGLAQKFREIDSKLADITKRLDLLRQNAGSAHDREIRDIIEEVKTITI